MVLDETSMWAIGVFGTFVLGTLVAIIKYFASKGKCLEIMKNDIENVKDDICELKDAQYRDNTTHKELFQQLRNIDVKLATIAGRLEKK